MLNNCIDTFNTCINLNDRIGLLVTCTAYNSDKAGNFFCFFHNRCDRLGGLLGFAKTCAYISHTFLDNCRCLLCGFLRTSCKIFYLHCNNREALTRLACSRSFNRGVESENVGLERDIFNNLYKFGDFFCGFIDIVHSGNKRSHVVCTCFKLCRRFLDNSVCLVCIFSIFKNSILDVAYRTRQSA